MLKYEYGNKNAENVLIQMVDDHDISEIPAEMARIKETAKDDFYLIAFKVNNWNHDLSPWEAPAVFGGEGFGGGAKETLDEVMKIIAGTEKRYYIGGYSLAGLFALWAAYQTTVFAGVAAASPSIWFPGFVDYMKANEIFTDQVYLSLGDREEKTRNPVMRTVGKCIRESYGLLAEKGVGCILEWNQGNHFKDAGERTGKAFAWLLGSEKNEPGNCVLHISRMI